MSLQRKNQILALLSNREFISGTVLGDHLNVSRAAVHKHVQSLIRQGIPIHRVPGRGYRLSQDFHLLETDHIRRHMDPDCAGRIKCIKVLQEVDSTNQWLRERQTQVEIDGCLCAAEMQSQGRGRRGNAWVASPYCNVLFSLGWEFKTWPESVTGLGLAASVAVAKALITFSGVDVRIKWPNDLMVGDAKLGGILIEVSGETSGQCTAIIGVGINVHIEDADASDIDQPWTDLRRSSEGVIDRNQLIATCSSQLVRMLNRFQQVGFPGFQAEWERMHMYTGCRARLTGISNEVFGLLLGVDDHGALLVRQDNGQVLRFYSSDVQLRALK